ncbi:MAG: pentapeptide repeat-containing protein [Candidatus Eremiobacteraeota bacterium]|nr:pentapeptide repeat-containing protein [Candidatus Eremiobacteraeota bacterium]
MTRAQLIGVTFRDADLPEATLIGVRAAGIDVCGIGAGSGTKCSIVDAATLRRLSGSSLTEAILP